MEIVPVITYLLLFAVIMLLLVLVFSLLFSKFHSKNDRGGFDLIRQNIKPGNSKKKIFDNINFVSSHNNESSPAISRNSQMFYLNKGREENMNLFTTQINYQQQYRNTHASSSKSTRLQGKPRFTIVNDTYGNEKHSPFYNTEESNYKYMRTPGSSS